MTKTSSSATSRKINAAAAAGFQPGNKLAAGGKGKAHSRFITQHLIAYLKDEISSPAAKTAEEKKKKATRVHWLVCKMTEMALDGNEQMIKLIFDRIEGTPLQTVHYKDIGDETEVPPQYTRDELRKLPPAELAKLYTTSLLADANPSDGLPN